MSRPRTREGYRAYACAVYAAAAVLSAAAILASVSLGHGGHVIAAVTALILAAGTVIVLVRHETWPRLRAGRDGTAP